MALHRRHLILAGLASTTALAGCFENTGENETEPEPESEEEVPEPEPEPHDEYSVDDFEFCDREPIVSFSSLPEPARLEVETAREEGTFETDEELFLPQLMPIDEHYLRYNQNDEISDYEVSVTESNGRNVLDVNEVIPVKHTDRAFSIENATDEDQSVTLEIELDTPDSIETIIEFSESIPAEETVETDPFDRIFEPHAHYRLSIETVNRSETFEWEENGNGHDTVTIQENVFEFQPRARPARQSCAEIWGTL